MRNDKFLSGQRSNMIAQFVWVLLFWFGSVGAVGAALVSVAELKRLVVACKEDSRGPYQGIRWFCPDGTVKGAQEPCPGGHQHALHKDIVQRVARENGLHLGQILTDTPFDAFWDSLQAGSRLKQYQMEKFLQGVDDGWIMR
ncbi:MAG: hypothetical protein ACI8V2_003267, partial [Candidatus Latescibacterota bacterium]